MSSFTFQEPSNILEACDLLASDPWGAKAISGGTAVVLMIKQGLIAPTTLVSLARLTELHGIRQVAGVLRIGAATTLAHISASDEVRQWFPSLAVACSEVGNPRIRNTATIGGNLAEADYASDPPATLASLGAECHLVGPYRTRTVRAIDIITGFYETVLEPGEIIDYIDIPIGVPEGSTRSTVYLKYRSRSSEDRACVGVAARADFNNRGLVALDVVVASVASTLQRVPSALSLAIGTTLDTNVVEQIARGYSNSIEPMEDARGSAWYRTKMIHVFVRRALQQLADQQHTRGNDYE